MVREEIFKTDTAVISQCDDTESFVLSMKNDEIVFKLCDLYAFKKKVMSLDVPSLFEADHPDGEIIYLPHCDRFLLLTIKEILEFRILLNGTFTNLANHSATQKVFRLSFLNKHIEQKK